MMKILTFIPILACVLANTCGAYQLVGTEALSEELVAHHYTINPNLDVVIHEQTWRTAACMDSDVSEASAL